MRWGSNGVLAKVPGVLTFCMCLWLVVQSVWAAPTRAGRPLHGPAVKFPQAFSSVGSVRELSNGLVLVTDPIANRLGVADKVSKESKPLEIRATGIWSFSHATPIFALGADSTIMDDALNGRVLTLWRTGAADSRARPITDRAYSSLSGADGLGHLLYFSFGPHLDGAPIRLVDSNEALLIDRSTGSVDSIAALDVFRAVLGGLPLAYQPIEHAALALDGWIAIPRLHPYHVDWRDPDGRWRRGPTIAPATPVTPREKAAYAARDRAAGRIPAPADLLAWPDSIPPFDAWTLIMTQHGEVAVRRTKTADHPEIRYDVVNRQGALVTTISVGKSQQVVGFGAHTVYVSDRQDEHHVWLLGYPWPQ
jgi:hypothetical protein